MQRASHHMIDANGVAHSVYEWNASAKGSKPSMVLVHATGFHARCWDQVIARLSDQHIYAVDMRGHGRSASKHFDNWQVFADDLIALARQLHLDNAIAIGHSMGGTTVLSAIAEAPELFSKCMLIDPVILAPSIYDRAKQSSEGDAPGASVAKRRRHFDSIDHFKDTYRERIPYSLFTSEAFNDYGDYATKTANSGEGVELACAPEFEANVYATSLSSEAVIDKLEQITIPATVLRAMPATNAKESMDFRYSSTWRELASKLPLGQDILLDDLSHFMPMQAPERIANLISAL